MDERKLKILAAVVDEYIRTGEPVGSKVVTQITGLKVSVATIRNDMSILEHLGFLEQPHTSAGRVPTVKGYRLYVEKLVPVQSLPESEIARLDAVIENYSNNHTENGLIKCAVTTLAELTQCAAVAADSTPKFSVVSKVDVIPAGKRVYVILLVTSNGSIKNRTCRLEFDLTHDQLDFFTKYLEENLHGITVADLSEEVFNNLVAAMGAYMVALSPLIKGLHELSVDLKQQEVTLGGESNLFVSNEFDKFEVVKFVEHKNRITDLLNDTFNGIQVKFGINNESFAIGNSSMIISQYQIGDRPAGSLGVIGPMRLDYGKIIPYIEYFTQKITQQLTGENDRIIIDATNCANQED